MVSNSIEYQTLPANALQMHNEIQSATFIQLRLCEKRLDGLMDFIWHPKLFHLH